MRVAVVHQVEQVLRAQLARHSNRYPPREIRLWFRGLHRVHQQGPTDCRFEESHNDVREWNREQVARASMDHVIEKPFEDEDGDLIPEHHHVFDESQLYQLWLSFHFGLFPLVVFLIK
ncbi:unnamed protein product [Linum trigynum]|uniref:Uncharacterized protein n=1 Tax=Linum trigynum TaxID=586398 RepID=A0AAV2E408_9ROSI